MKLIIVFGPPAVGKMTVGKAIAEKTGLKLLHNHMSIELVLNFFDFDEPGFDRLNSLIRNAILKEIAESEHKGAVFTYVWALDHQSDEDYLKPFMAHFEDKGGEVYFVELEADLDKRLIRNKHPDRLAAKASKRNLEQSERALLTHEKQYRFNSKEGEFAGKKHIKINNNTLSPEEVADIVIGTFSI